MMLEVRQAANYCSCGGGGWSAVWVRGHRYIDLRSCVQMVVLPCAWTRRRREDRMGSGAQRREERGVGIGSEQVAVRAYVDAEPELAPGLGA